MGTCCLKHGSEKVLGTGGQGEEKADVSSQSTLNPDPWLELSRSKLSSCVLLSADNGSNLRGSSRCSDLIC